MIKPSIALAVAFISLPTSSFAMTSSQGVTTKQAGGCAELTTRLTTIDSKFATEQASRQSSLAADDLKLTQYRQTLDQKLAAERAGWDRNRASSLTLLEANPGQYSATAISAYEIAIKAAVATKRSSNDSSTATFRAGKDQAIASRRSTVQQALVARNTGISADYTGAASQCGAGSDMVSVRSAIRAQIVGQQQQFKTADSGSIAADKTQIQTLTQVRKQTESATFATFKAAIEAARQTLKASVTQK